MPSRLPLMEISLLMELIFTLDQIQSVARHFLNDLNDAKVIALHGDMGAGKTTLIHALCIELGVIENVSSPTFSIIHEYQAENNEIIYHIDLYRLNTEKEAYIAGIEECLYSGERCFIEWPEKIPTLLPENVVNVYLEALAENKRRLVYKLQNKKSL